MAFLFLIVAAFMFLIGALAPLFKWDLGTFSALYWGLFFLAVSFLVPGVYAGYKARRLP